MDLRQLYYDYLNIIDNPEIGVNSEVWQSINHIDSLIEANEGLGMTTDRFIGLIVLQKMRRDLYATLLED